MSHMCTCAPDKEQREMFELYLSLEREEKRRFNTVVKFIRKRISHVTHARHEKFIIRYISCN